MSDSGKAVFLSYASQDAEAAGRVAEELRAAGVEVWFDQSELVGGDAWDHKIRQQIRDCALFVPLISANTQARHEGYFRLEWKLAIDRSHLIAQDRAFLLPVVIDDTKSATARVPERFLEVQWTRLPGGETATTFCAQVKRLLASHATVAGGGDSGPASTRPATTRPRQSRLLAWLAGSAAALAIGGGTAWWSLRAPEETSAVRQLVIRARTIFEAGHLTRENLEAAERLINEARERDPTDGEVWAAASQVHTWYVFYKYDDSHGRKQRARADAASALNLAPDSFEARFAQACVLVDVVANADVRPEAEQLLRDLLRERPNDARVADHLGLLLRADGRTAEAAEFFLRAKNPAGAAWTYFETDDAVKARQALQQALPTDRSPDTLMLSALLEADVAEDLDAAQRALDEIPPSARMQDSIAGVQVSIALALGRRQRVLDWVETVLVQRQPRWQGLHAYARFGPAFDPLRGDPRFERLLRANLPEGAKPFSDSQAESSP
jgi:Tfp pilus assembly protein PilF